MRHFVAAEMRKKGVDLRVGSDVTSIEKTADGLRAALLDGSTLTADSVLYATGRSPNTAGLGLADLVE